MNNALAYKAQKIKAVREKLSTFFDTMVQIYGGDDTIAELMALRGYRSKKMYHTLKDTGIYLAPTFAEIRTVCPQFTLQDFVDFGIVTSEGDYFMTGRYVLPIKDVNGTIIALVGWDRNGGSRKYLTTTTYGFYRDASFFNYNVTEKVWSERNGIVIVVEGIFDSLALTSVGFPAIAAMGLELSHLKEIMLSRFRRVIVIADNDRGGKSVNPYLYYTVKGITYASERAKDDKVWNPQTLTTFVGLPDAVGDPDEYVKDYAMEEELEKLYNIEQTAVSALLFVQLQ